MLPTGQVWHHAIWNFRLDDNLSHTFESIAPLIDGNRELCQIPTDETFTDDTCRKDLESICACQNFDATHFVSGSQEILSSVAACHTCNVSSRHEDAILALQKIEKPFNR